MNKITSKSWWKGALERAGSQAAEAILPLIIAGALLDTELWPAALGVGIGGAIASLLFSIVSLPEHAGKVRSRFEAIAYRLLRTAAAATLAVIGTNELNIFDFDWSTAASTVATVTAIAFLKMVAKQPQEAEPAIATERS